MLQHCVRPLDLGKLDLALTVLEPVAEALKVIGPLLPLSPRVLDAAQNQRVSVISWSSALKTRGQRLV